MSAYELILTVHVLTFSVNIILVIAADLNALRWVLGWKQVLSSTLMRRLHRLISVGLGVSVITGLYLFWGVRDYLLTVPAFYTKLLLVVMLVVNSFFIGKHIMIATKRSFTDLSSAERRPLYISGIVSMCGWVGVYVVAQFLGLS